MPRIFHKNLQEHIEPIHRVYRPLGKMLWHNFLGGISWSIGVTVGLAFFVGVITFIFTLLGGVPIIGEFAAGIVEAINQSLQKR